MKTWLLTACLAMIAPSFHAAETQETLASSYGAFLEGRLDDAASGFRYLAALGVAAHNLTANQALIARDTGRQDAALPLWIQSSLAEGADGFVWNQRAWSYLSADNLKEAKESFLKAIDRSSTTASQAEANLGLGVTALAHSQPKAAMAPLRSALVQGPYIIPAASYQTALTALAMGDKQAALAYLRQSVETDPLFLESLKAMARLYERIGENRSAWRVFHRVLSLDPLDQETARRIKKLTQYIVGNPETSRAIRRLSRPVLQPGLKGLLKPSASAQTLRVGLFAGEEGKPATALRFYFVANSDFRLIAANGETVKDDGKSLEQWEIQFRPENGLVEVRDPEGNIQFTAKQPFRIVPIDREGTVLVKSVEFLETFGFDPGDRELRGTLEIFPAPHGFKLINELRLEDYLYGAVASALPQASPLQAYKAQAVLSRTLALWSQSQAAPSMERLHICDSAYCQRYLGVSEEMRAASQGVAETEGLVLSHNGRLAKVMQHENCGGVSEDGIADSAQPASPLFTPLELERWTHEFPPRNRFCEAGSLTPAVQSRWVRLIKADDLKTRAERIKPVGPLRHIRALRRSPAGRVRSLEVVGTRGTLLLEGDKAISDFLSPGSLRSMLFTISPLMKGQTAESFILWGAGSGHGLGMCRAGAIGQASLGRDFRVILAHYFPSYKLKNLPSSSSKSKLKTQAAKKPKNPHRKK
ncbi:MAG: hypothetical protein A3J74_07210 [Elusimicrobia bacterium RIFCSPHIGHO2_02_FULL_57_9]|nr:MAG: hypothetical protein A3J74_07210 [Elusimicrobia bacterium RIFCSPHIGHO2_02_FULL_57_9]